MKLWKLERTKQDRWLDLNNTFVVRAESEAAARSIVARRHGYEVEVDADWFDPNRSTCVRIREDGPAEIVLCDFSVNGLG
jgi:hypothetical protein